MALLTDTQTRVVSERLMSYSDQSLIQIDLEDHICCLIEEKIEAGASFDKALDEAFSVFDRKYIIDLNQAALFLTKTNITMTRRTIAIGIAGLGLCLLALIGKNLNITGSNETLIIGTAIMIFGFFLSNILNLNRNLQVMQIKVINWVGFVGVAGVLIGTMFRVLKYYSFSTGFLITGGVLLMIYFIASTFKLKSLIS